MTCIMAFKGCCFASTHTINNEREEQITRNAKVIKSLLERGFVQSKVFLFGVTEMITQQQNLLTKDFFVNWFSSGLKLIKCCKIT